MSDELRIDPEFRDKIPPLTDDEFGQLEENIVEAGEVYEPIRTWNGVIVDGHNRYKVIQKHPEVKWTTREMDFPDKWAAFEWMYKNQLGRRNLTENQRTYMIGKMYEARKKSVGAQEGHVGRNQHTSANSDKMSELATRRKKKDGTAGRIGKEVGIDGKTVRRAEIFSKGIDVLCKVSSDAVDKVLSGNSKAKKKDVMSLAGIQDPESQRQIAELILADKSPSAVIKQMTDSKSTSTSAQTERQNQSQSTSDLADSEVQEPHESHEPIDDIPVNYIGNSAYNREVSRITNEIARQLADVDAPSTYNMDDLIEELTFNGEKAVKIAKNTVELRRNLLVSKEEKVRVKNALLSIINGFKEVVKSI